MGSIDYVIIISHIVGSLVVQFTTNEAMKQKTIFKHGMSGWMN